MLLFFILDSEPVSPVRFLIAVWAPVLVAQWGLTRKSLDRSGALAGWLTLYLQLSFMWYVLSLSLSMTFVRPSRKVCQAS